MKKKVLSVIVSACAAVGVFALSSCASAGKSTRLGAPAAATPLSYQERQDEGLNALRTGAENFASKFAAETFKATDDGKNFAVAPISVYMALSVASECANGQTREEILNGLNVEYSALKNNFSKLYRSLIAENRSNTGDLEGRLNLTNSIWLNSGWGDLGVKSNCINSLADNYYCHSYSADFMYDNGAANRALQDFIKKQTYGLIDKNFEISNESTFVLLNTLYLKDIWNDYGKDLSLTDENYQFTERDGDIKVGKLLQGYYSTGRAYEEQTFTHFYTKTLNGYKIKFILPKDGYTVKDVFTQENIARVNALTDYNAVDEENLLRYHTRCLFPQFSASFDKDVKSVLAESFGIRSMFNADECDFSSVASMPSYCSKVRHVTKLNVDKKGIEGAAVTAMSMDGAPGPDEYRDVYEDFVVDRAFGFILTDRYGTTVFSGVVNNI